MTGKRVVCMVAVGLLLVLIAGLTLAQGPQSGAGRAPRGVLGTAFTYQGLLRKAGTPVDVACNFQFSLWDASSLGTQIGDTLIRSNVAVGKGLFTIPDLDFGQGAFQGDARYLEIVVQCPGDPGYIVLTPRQALTPTPYALALPGLWTQQNVTSTNLIGGYSGNAVAAGVVGATIGGGGDAAGPNQVSGPYATVGGGWNNEASGAWATVGGGRSNKARADYATIAGGGPKPDWVTQGNTVTDLYGTVGGGEANWAGTDDGDPNNASHATVGGGRTNQASAYAATVAGGDYNHATQPWATIGGGQWNAATADHATIAGGENNTADGSHATVTGGYSNTVTGTMSFIGGGSNNSAGGDGAAVTCGQNNTASGEWASIDGGHNNLASGRAATIGGGWDNRCSDEGCTVGGGGVNSASSPRATVGGGGSNIASGDSATVGGGMLNASTGLRSTIGGGEENSASGERGTVAGGGWNVASGSWASIGGGLRNVASGTWGSTVGGGEDNTASAPKATVGGGQSNSASGDESTVPGGKYNRAEGLRSLAAGYRAVARHVSAFVWGDSAEAEVTSPADNTFIVRANGGLWFGQASTAITPTIGAGVFISTSTGAYLSTGGTWTNASDRNAKENLASVDGQEVLARLVGVPVATWNYASQDPSIRHIGPMAQDFYAAFGLGEDDKHISTVDADGVALAAIQGLYEQNQALSAENAAQQAQIDALEARLATLEAGGGHAPSRGAAAPGGWLLGGGLVAIAVVVGRSRRRSGR